MSENSSAADSVVSETLDSAGVRKLSELRVIDLKAELKKRNLDVSGNKSMLSERLKKAIEEEGGDPDEIVVQLEITPKKTVKRTPKGKKNETDESEDCAAEEESVDGQDDAETQAENIHDMDIMDMNILDEADMDDGGADEEYHDDDLLNDNYLDYLADPESKTKRGDDRKPEEEPKGIKGELESEKVAGSCKSEPLKEEPTEESPEEEKASVWDDSCKAEGNVSDLAKAEEAANVEGDIAGVKQAQVKEGAADAESASAQAHETSLHDLEKAEGMEEDKKTEESAADSSDVKESSVEGGDQKKSSDEKGKGDKGSAASTGRNLWVSGLASTTRATDLKNLFSKHGKVVGAKVVTNARSPGARCYGFVTMSSVEEATNCITHLHRTELHGRMISVERAKNEPAGKKVGDKKNSSDNSGKEDGSDDKGERTVVMDKSKGEPVVSVRTKSKERSSKSRDRKSSSRDGKDILSFDQIKEQRERERQRQREREIREAERRRQSGERDSRSERERIRLFREREERERLLRKRNWLEAEKQRLNADRMEREFLERERMRVEYERRREQERIHREREELRRQQDQLRYEQDRRPLKRPYDMDGRKEDWPVKRMAMDDRYGRSDFGRQDRFQDIDHRDRGRYQDDMFMDRRDGPRGGGMPADRDGQHFSERHGRDSRDNWAGGSFEKRPMNAPRPVPGGRDARDWEPGRKMDGDRPWQGAERGMPGQGHIGRGAMAGRGAYMQAGASQNLSATLNRPNQMMQGSGIQGSGAFGRRY